MNTMSYIPKRAKNERIHIDKMKLPNHISYAKALLYVDEDCTTVAILQQYDTVLEHTNPRTGYGDGNSMCSLISPSLYGTQVYQEHIMLLDAIEKESRKLVAEDRVLIFPYHYVLLFACRP